MSRASGAGAYSHAVAIGALSARRAMSCLGSVNGEVIRVLVTTGALLADLHQHVVEQRGRADPVAIGCEPRESERLVNLHEELDRLLRLSDATGDLHADDAPGLLVHVADHLEHA